MAIETCAQEELDAAQSALELVQRLQIIAESNWQVIFRKFSQADADVPAFTHSILKAMDGLIAANQRVALAEAFLAGRKAD